LRKRRGYSVAWKWSGAGRWPRGAAIALAAFVGLAATGCVVLESKERELVFRPVREYVRTPADLGYRYEDLWIEVAGENGGASERVHAWWLPAGKAEAPAILYLHGIRWSLGNNLFRIARWRELGFSVLAIDYRGFGRSDGELPSEAQIYADARAAWAELKRREPAGDRRFIYGHSLGAAVAIDLAAGSDGAAGVIAEAGFTSLADVVAESSTALSLLVTQKFDALSKAKALKVPALFLHGTQDRLVPPAMSERLYEATPSPKRLHWIEGAGHGNWNGTGMDDYRRVVLEFVVGARTLAAVPGGMP
jgi:alpha-beta hydrolase superfamily lysophospholipase